MPSRMKTVASAGLMLLLVACASHPATEPAPSAVARSLATSVAQLSTGPAPDKPFSIGRAATDTVGGYLPDGRTVSPFDTTNPVIAWLDPALLAAVRSAAKGAAADGVDLQITSGWRSKGFQQRLFDDAVRTYGNADLAAQFVASPETSHHVIGKAVDVGPVEADNWLIRNGSRYGLCQIFANEIWHFELVAAEDGSCPALKPNAAG